ncbi:hypothetical protein [Pigmentiphaga kullae]|nr:hypothetical protein [Pigmentiphaga kullae]
MMTHTLAILELSPIAYGEVADKLRAAGYDHVFLEDGMLDMSGLGVTCGVPLGDPSPECDPTDICAGCRCKFAAGGHR